MILLKAGLHAFPDNTFGNIDNLKNPQTSAIQDTLLVACLEMGTAPNYISIANPDRFVILQHLAASIPSLQECDTYSGLSIKPIEALFEKYEFRNVILTGHFGCRCIPYWLKTPPHTDTDIGYFRERFNQSTRRLFEQNYVDDTNDNPLSCCIVCEHVLCQVENMLTHPFISERVLAKESAFYAWVVDDKTARVFGYNPLTSAFSPI